MTALDGSPLRRTDYRGVAWFGGRQVPQTGGSMVMRSQAASISSPFWLPDSHPYQTASAARIIVTISVGTLYVAENCALADVSAVLHPDERNPDVSFVLCRLQGAARVPLGISYNVSVIAPPEAVLAG